MPVSLLLPALSDDLTVDARRVALMTGFARFHAIALDLALATLLTSLRGAPSR